MTMYVFETIKITEITLYFKYNSLDFQYCVVMSEERCR